MTRQAGLVSFVSLGPGDPALHTVRGAARLAEADVVVSEGEPGDPAVMERIIALARDGKHVARAVGGDLTKSVPVMREVLAVVAAGLPFELVPGVGARSAAVAFAGLVGRGRRVRVADVERDLEGEPAEAVVTLIARIGTAQQRELVTTAEQAPARARTMGGNEAWLTLSFGAPDANLRWFTRQPLFGKRILVTRAAEQAEGAAALLREAGAEPVVVPTIVLALPDDPEPLVRAVAALRAGSYAWVAFTSSNGVERTWDAIAASGGDARVFGASRLAAIGPATTAALQRHGLRPDLQAKEFRGDGLAAAMFARPDVATVAPDRRVLIARAAKGSDVLPEALRAAGWTVDVVAAYQTRHTERSTIEALIEELGSGRIDIVTFTSSSTVESLCDGLGADAVRLLAGPRIASIGPVTTETARARGLRVDVTATESTLPGLVRAIARHEAEGGSAAARVLF